MGEFTLLAKPWWVNLFIFVPFVANFIWRKSGLVISRRILTVAAFFGVAFGFVEAAVVVYLRAAMGLLPGYGGTLGDVARLSSELYQNAQLLSEMPVSLFTVEVFREAATMIMLLSVTRLATNVLRVRCAVFLWIFASWDISYYVGLWATVRWPPSLLAPDALFLIPVPWVAPVWFPILVSALTMIAVVFARRSGERRL
jgi:hypothetical protein